MLLLFLARLYAIFRLRLDLLIFRCLFVYIS